MADDRLLAMGVGAAQGIERASENLMNIMLAKDKLKKEHTTFQLDTKIKKLELQKAEGALADPAQLKAERDRDAAKAKFENARYTLGLQMIEEKESGIRKDLDASSIGLTEKGFDPFGGSPLTTAQRQKGEREKQRLLSVLNQGSYAITKGTDQGVYDLTNRGEAAAYASSGEFDVDLNDPDIQAAIDQYKPAEVKKGAFQDFPTREKFGHKWEKRADGKWHKLGSAE